MCKVYTGYHGTSEISMVYAPVRTIIPSLKLGDNLSVQAHKPCSISYLLAKDKIYKICTGYPETTNAIESNKVYATEIIKQL